MPLPRPRWRLSTLFVVLTAIAPLIYVNSRPHSPATVGFYMPADAEPGPDWPVFGFHYGWPWAFLTNPEPAYHPGAEASFRHVFWTKAALDLLVAAAIVAAAIVAWEGFLWALRRRHVSR